MTLPERHTARLLVLDPADRLLLIAYEAARDLDPARPGHRRLWYTPGGGLEPGESHEQAALRELAEETGITDAALGPCVARQSGPVTVFRRQAFTHARYFLVRCRTDRIDTRDLAATEGDPVLDVRWWPLAELEASGEFVLPAGVVALVRDALAGGLEAAPRLLA